MDKAGNNQALTGREASRARRRAIAAGGKSTQTQSESVRTAARSDTRRAARETVASSTQSTTSTPGAPGATPKPSREARRVAATRTQGREHSMQRRARLARGQAGESARNTPQLKSATQGLSGREAAIARRRAIAGIKEPEAKPRQSDAPKDAPPRPRTRTESVRETAPPAERRSRLARARSAGAKANVARGRMASMARRAATAERGKTGAEAFGGRSRNAAATTLMRNSGVSSREIAKRVREERCEHGKCGTSGARPSGRARRTARSDSGGTPSKVELSETASGQRLSGTRVGRSARTTGDETGSCRTVTGTEYFGAELFQEFCSITPEPAPNRATGATLTSGGQSLTGTQVGREPRVTGDETGAGRELTGTPYTAPGPEGAAPPKVGRTETLSGGQVTGSLSTRGERMTGNEPGTCQRVTGDEYLGAEELRTVCKSDPQPSRAPKVGVDATWHGQRVSGTQVGRPSRVTGDEAGVCERVTGTAYLGTGRIIAECGPDTARRLLESATTPAPAALPALPAEDNTAAAPGSDDFPQPLDGGVWEGQQPESSRAPAPAVITAPRQPEGRSRTVTGTAYAESGNRVTGPFNMAAERVTGTEEFRMRRANTSAPELLATDASQALETSDSVPARPRITGEGMDGGLRITGDDWGRGESVTGTEGRSAVGRNPTRRGTTMGPFAGAQTFRDSRESAGTSTPEPRVESRVTGASGSTDRGARVTLSGGARG